MGVAVATVVLADLLVIGFCVFYLSRAGRVMDQRWQQQRDALDMVRGSLERLVGEADERAREFEQVLGARETQLRKLLHELAQEEERVHGARRTEGGPPTFQGLAQEVDRLAGAGLGPLEVARKLNADPAQVRLIFDLQKKGAAGQKSVWVIRKGLHLEGAEQTRGPQGNSHDHRIDGIGPGFLVKRFGRRGEVRHRRGFRLSPGWRVCPA